MSHNVHDDRRCMDCDMTGADFRKRDNIDKQPAVMMLNELHNIHIKSCINPELVRG